MMLPICGGCNTIQSVPSPLFAVIFTIHSRRPKASRAGGWCCWIGAFAFRSRRQQTLKRGSIRIAAYMAMAMHRKRHSQEGSYEEVYTRGLYTRGPYTRGLYTRGHSYKRPIYKRPFLQEAIPTRSYRQEATGKKLQARPYWKEATGKTLLERPYWKDPTGKTLLEHPTRTSCRRAYWTRYDMHGKKQYSQTQ
jgi:hypothetical protein